MEFTNIKKSLKVIKNFLTISLLIIVFFAVVGNISAMNGKLYDVMHFRNYVVLTGSMEPKILPGDYITVIKINKDRLKSGDVITYDKEGMTVTHEIVEIYEEYIITQGTANNIPDDPIKKEDVIGKYLFKVPSAGYIMNYLSSKSGLILIFGFIGIAIFWEMTDPERAKRKKEISTEQSLLEKQDIIRTIIFDNLSEFGMIKREEEKVINSECNIDILKEWSRKSARVDSIEQFFEIIKEAD